MSNSVRPHRWQPTRLPHPQDSPGKNNGVGCHFLLQCIKVKSESEVAQLCPTLSDPMDCSLPGSSVHGFSRQEYWSGVPLPSPSLLYKQIKKNMIQKTCTTQSRQLELIDIYRLTHQTAEEQSINEYIFVLKIQRFHKQIIKFKRIRIIQNMLSNHTDNKSVREKYQGKKLFSVYLL